MLRALKGLKILCKYRGDLLEAGSLHKSPSPYLIALKNAVCRCFNGDFGQRIEGNFNHNGKPMAFGGLHLEIDDVRKRGAGSIW